MRFLPLLLTLAMTLGLSACSEAEPSVSTSQPSQGVVSNQQEADGSNILIAYFSVPENVSTDDVDAVSGASIVVDNDEVLGSTEYVAQVIQQTIGGDLFRIEAAEPYPLDHEPLVDQAAEERDNQVRPELTSHVDHFEQYEVILLGYPIWWGDMPMPVYSFLEEYDFSMVIPLSNIYDADVYFAYDESESGYLMSNYENAFTDNFGIKRNNEFYDAAQEISGTVVLTTGEIAGIIVGALVLLAAERTLIVIAVRRGKKRMLAEAEARSARADEEELFGESGEKEE